MTKKRTVYFISNEGSPIKSVKSGRNSLCACGSGKKSKKCCNADTRYRLTGKAEEKARQRVTVDADKEG